MKSIVATYLLLLCASMSMAWPDPYKRLSKLYEKNPDKCFKKAEKMIGRKTDAAAPYFFAASYQLEAAKKDQKDRYKYGHLNKALNYTKYLFRKDTSSLAMHEVSPMLIRNEILDSASSFTKYLFEEGDSSRGNNLLRKYAALTGEDPLWLVEAKVAEKEKEKADKIAAKKKAEADRVVYIDVPTAFKNQQYFGLPTGSEQIVSANLSEEKKVVELLNADRRSKGLRPLIWNEDLARAARYHSYDMATQNYFNHDSYDSINGKLVPVAYTFTRIKKFYTESFVNSENLAAGSEDGDGTYHQWYTSPGHYANMFNPSSKYVGVGYYFDPNSTFGHYWSFCTALP
jgi:uncharacterized protein YkwD